LVLFGRIERTLFTLDWLLDKDLRQRVTTEFEQVVHRIGRLSAEVAPAQCGH
jgi:TnpA family transposase